MKRLLIILSFFTGSLVFAQEKQDIESLLSEVEEGVIVGESGIVYEQEELTVTEEAPAATGPAVSAPASVPAPAPQKAAVVKEAPSGDVYHYAYTPKDSESVNYSKDDENITAGHPGVFIMSIFGEWVNYYTGNKNKGGASLDLGVQFNLSDFISLALTTNIGGREGNEAGNALSIVGFRFAPRFRILPWLFLFPEAGVEFTKIAKGDWEYPFWVMGGGMMINMGSLDRRAEYNFNKQTAVTRTLLIVCFDRIKSPNVIVSMPDAYLVRLGLSLEF